ncbi:MAG: NADH-quinone oxidoreductase subunit G [Proteobacteria bacterium]|nr:NADH-quinone oxidoreductase subunit G [Pseudomonadota bacterium]MBS0463516.1 NADH-quinone oxidoreductase subunit G [Pseudomonadota bacterium]
MVNIEIDGVALHAPKGSMIIAAADKAGIPIPRFCYHEKLPIAANCRMCMVETEMNGKPVPKPQPACATPVMEGMKVHTQSQRALSGQRNAMEFLLINHPLDCPVCDQGGECELQDLSLGYGRSVSRFAERKRVVADEDLGPLVATEMTRCIHCTRCIRVTAEVAGTYELGGMERGERLKIGTYDGKPLTTELSGNVIDVCPVGALTNKVFRFRARPWELIARPSLGYHDALGSNLFVHLRRGEVMRAVPRDNEAVNECWLSDRDRYSHQGLYAADRAQQPQVKDGEGVWRECSWDDALLHAGEILKAHRGDALGVLVHPATSNEEGALLARLAKGLGCGNIDHRLRTNDFADAPVAEPFGMAVADVEHADAIVLIGCNPRTEMPLLAYRIRKAVKRGAKVYAINPVDFDLLHPLADRRIVKPSQLAAAVQGIADGADELADVLETAKNAVVILGEIALNHPQASRIRAAARSLAAACDAKLNAIPSGANAVGLARVGVLPSGRDAAAMLAQPRGAYLLYGIEPDLDFAAALAARKALGASKVVAFSHFASQSTRAVADVILPIGLLPEIDATLSNVDGLAQSVPAAGKLPGQTKPGWRVLRSLGAQLGLDGFEFLDLAGLRAGIVDIAVASGSGLAPMAPAAATAGTFERVTTTPIYRGDAVLRRCTALQAQAQSKAACIVLHPDDANALGLTKGAMAKVADVGGQGALPVELSTRVARGSAWIESCHGATAAIGHGLIEVARA